MTGSCDKRLFVKSVAIATQLLARRFEKKRLFSLVRVMTLETVFSAGMNRSGRVAQCGIIFVAAEAQLTSGLFQQVLSVRAVYFMTRAALVESYRCVDGQGCVGRDIVMTFTADFPLLLFQQLGIWSGVTIMAVVTVCSFYRRVRKRQARGRCLVTVATGADVSRRDAFCERYLTVSSREGVTGVATAFGVRGMSVRRD